MGTSAVAERPGRLEIVGIVVGCLLLLVLLARMDDAAVRQEAAKAAAVKQPAVERRDDSGGVDGALLFGMAGVGVAMTAAGAAMLRVSRRSV